ncbi:MAG: hemolysin family protein [Cyanobacteriota bacterium]|nr:hemolysin family protein [Cyanobacteriota bacterium]
MMNPRSGEDDESNPYTSRIPHSVWWIALTPIAVLVLIESPAWSTTATSSQTALAWSDIFWRILSVFGLIAINAFFVTAEFAMVSVRRSRISQLVDEGDLQAKTVQNLQSHIDLLLSTTQLGITLSSLALGWIGEKTMASLVLATIERFSIDGELGKFLTHSIAIPIAFLLVAYLQIVLGELCPKSLALLYSEDLARLLGPPSLTIAHFFSPFLWILNQSTHWLLRLVGISYSGQGWYNRVTPEELQLIIATDKESTGLEAEERELLNNVFEFGDVTVDEVMVPRTSFSAISENATFQNLLHEVATSGHSGYPAIGESLDDVRGIVYFKELAEPLAQGVLTVDTPIQSWIRPARFVPEYMLLSELLPLMQRLGQPMVMVVDEYGGTAGLVTIQDLVAQIIGDRSELEDSEDLSVQAIDDRTFAVQAQMHVEEVNELLALNLPSIDEYQTLAGFTIYHMQKIPLVGEILHYDGLELKVIAAEGPRLDRIEIRRGPSTQDSNSTLDRALLVPESDWVDNPDDSSIPPEAETIFPPWEPETNSEVEETKPLTREEEKYSGDR